MYLLDFGTCISYLYTVAMMISKTYIFTVFGIQRTSLFFPLQWRRKIIKLKKLEAKWYIAIKPLMGYIKGFRPSALIFHEWNKIVSYSFSSTIQIIRGMKRGSFLQHSTLCLIMIWRKLDTVRNILHIFMPPWKRGHIVLQLSVGGYVGRYVGWSVGRSVGL